MDHGPRAGSSHRKHRFVLFMTSAPCSAKIWSFFCGGGRYGGSMTASDRTLFDVNGDGFTIFEGLSLKLRADVFVPRGESRHLIHAATRSLDKVETNNLPFHVLYVCEKLGQRQTGTNMSCFVTAEENTGYTQPCIWGVMEQHFDHHDLRLLDVTLGVGNGLLPLLKRLDGELCCQHRIEIVTVSVWFELYIYIYYIIHLSYNLFSSSMWQYRIHLPSSVPSFFRVSRFSSTSRKTGGIWIAMIHLRQVSFCKGLGHRHQPKGYELGQRECGAERCGWPLLVWRGLGSRGYANLVFLVFL